MIRCCKDCPDRRLACHDTCPRYQAEKATAEAEKKAARREKAEAIRRMRIKRIHFAWDRMSDREQILPKFQMFRELTGWDRRKMTVYVLCGYDTDLEQDLERIYTLRDLGYGPYVMIYDKYKRRRKDPLVRMQRWVNSRYAFAACRRFEEYTG